jgi:spore coat protein CotH
VFDLASAADAQLRLRFDATNAWVRVEGDANDEWRLQVSQDLKNWNEWLTFDTLPGRTERALPLDRSALLPAFFRALKTSGLYDPTFLRTLSLTFTQANWQQQLTANYNSGTNLVADLAVNGTPYRGVGVRYKGNTSYSRGGRKKSLNIQIDHSDPELRLMGYETVNLNNANGDNSLMREPLYFNVLRQYTVGPRGAFVRLVINDEYWGVYSLAQQQDGDLINEWFESNDGDRWKAPSGNGGGGGTTGGGGRGGGGFASGDRALKYLGESVTAYQGFYDLQKQNSSNAWPNLIHAIDVLNNTSTSELRDKVEEVLAVDRWLWFLALENIFADDDSYWNKGADYKLYYEPESGQIHPIEHDGNEVFIAGDVRLSPMQGEGNANRPVVSRLLAVPELRQRYLAHMRTVLQESFNPEALNPVIEQYRQLIEPEVEKDTKKGFTMQAFQSSITGLKNFVQQRRAYLLGHAELTPMAPVIVTVSSPETLAAGQPASFTSEIRTAQSEGIEPAWLYYRTGPTGRFTRVQMFDDGAHHDGQPGDGTFGAATERFLAGTTVHYYVEARSANAAKASSFSPDHAEHETFSFRVITSPATGTPLVINELMASNTTTVADPQGEYDDWIELRNLTSEEVDLTGRYLSDDSANPRKWPFPSGTRVPANGFLIIWADEDGTASPGLHTNFKLSADGEEILLVDSDGNYNALLDSVTFSAQQTDRSHGRPPNDPDVFINLPPTPGRQNISP